MKNLFSKSFLILAAGGLIIAGSAVAQTTTSGAGPGTYDPGHPRVNEVNGREANQENRINNGVKNGQLTQGQATRLQNGENRIQNQEKRDMAAHDGHLTKGEQRHLNREQNRESRRITNAKHN